jgi:hypothetical protein
MTSRLASLLPFPRSGARRRRGLPLACAALLALALPAVAQEAGQPAQAPAPAPAQTPPPPSLAPGQPPILDARELVVKYVRPQHATAHALAKMLEGLHHRQYFARNEDGSVVGPYANIETFGELIVLHDTPAQLRGLEATLAGLEQSLAGDAAQAAVAQLHVQEYVPRHQSINNLQRALDSFRRTVSNDSPSAGGPPMQVQNVTALQDPALLVLRDTPENVAAMLALLERLDVPAPQVLLTCVLLRPLDGVPAESGDELSPELVAGLRALVPYDAFGQVGLAALRVAVVPGRELSVFGNYSGGRQFRLMLQPSGYDAAGGLLTLDRCRFKAADGEELETGLTLRTGEDTVLGASGEAPLFVVLRVTPLDK